MPRIPLSIGHARKRNRAQGTRRGLQRAQRAAQASPHPNVKVGAVVVTPDGRRTLATGMNSPPDGIAITPARLLPGEKNLWFMCAEKRALTAAQNNRSQFGLKNLKGCGMYSTLMPCHTCAHDIIQAGIAWVCVPAHAEKNYPKLKKKYRRSMAAAAEMLAEKGIRIIALA